MKILITELQYKKLIGENNVPMEFEAYKGVKMDFEPHDGPMFFTQYYDGAQYYGIHRLEGKVMTAIIRFNNPLIVNAYQPPSGNGYGEGIPIYKDENGDKWVGSDNFIGTFSDNDINEKVKSHGYDGVIINKKFGNPIDGWEVLSFDSSTREFNFLHESPMQFKKPLIPINDFEKFFNDDNTKDNENPIKDKLFNELDHVKQEMKNYLNSTDQSNKSPLEIYGIIGFFKHRIQKIRLMIEGEVMIAYNTNKQTGVRYIVGRTYWIDNSGDKMKKFSINLGPEKKILVNNKIPQKLLDNLRKQLLDKMWDTYSNEYDVNH